MEQFGQNDCLDSQDVQEKEKDKAYKSTCAMAQVRPSRPLCSFSGHFGAMKQVHFTGHV